MRIFACKLLVKQLGLPPGYALSNLPGRPGTPASWSPSNFILSGITLQLDPPSRKLCWNLGRCPLLAAHSIPSSVTLREECIVLWRDLLRLCATCVVCVLERGLLHLTHAGKKLNTVSHVFKILSKESRIKLLLKFWFLTVANWIIQVLFFLKSVLIKG